MELGNSSHDFPRNYVVRPEVVHDDAAPKPTTHTECTNGSVGRPPAVNFAHDEWKAVRKGGGTTLVCSLSRRPHDQSPCLKCSGDRSCIVKDDSDQRRHEYLADHRGQPRAADDGTSFIAGGGNIQHSEVRAD